MTPLFPPQMAETKKHMSFASCFTAEGMNPGNGPHPEASVRASDMMRSHARSGGGTQAIVANIAALEQAQQDTRSLDASVQDWDMMFRAVEERLSSAVGKVLVATPGLEPQTAAALVQTIVLECVAALDQLHAALTHERRRRHQLEQETGDAQAALADGLTRSASPGAGKDGFVS